jgi:hypothetical protein
MPPELFGMGGSPSTLAAGLAKLGYDLEGEGERILRAAITEPVLTEGSSSVPIMVTHAGICWVIGMHSRYKRSPAGEIAVAKFRRVRYL